MSGCFVARMHVSFVTFVGNKFIFCFQEGCFESSVQLRGISDLPQVGTVGTTDGCFPNVVVGWIYVKKGTLNRELWPSKMMKGFGIPSPRGKTFKLSRYLSTSARISPVMPPCGDTTGNIGIVTPFITHVGPPGYSFSGPELPSMKASSSLSFRLSSAVISMPLTQLRSIASVRSPWKMMTQQTAWPFELVTS